MFYSAIRPRVYEFVSLECCKNPCISSWCSSWRSPNTAVAAARSMKSAAVTHV